MLSQLESGASLGSFEHTDLEDIDKNLSMSLSYSKKGYANKLGDSLIFQTPSNLRIPLNMSYGEVVSLPPDERNYPILVSPAEMINQITFTYPRERELVVPEAVSMENDLGSYSSVYNLDEGKLTIKRVFTIKQPLIPVDGYGEFQKLINAMRKDQKASFQLKGG